MGKFRMKKNWKKLIVTALCVLMIAAFFATSVTAKSKAPRNSKYIDKAGHVYIMKHGKPRTGYFKYHGKYYYGHKTSSKKYPKGSVTQGQFRIKSPGKWYAYDVNGAQIRKDYYVRKGYKKILQLDIRHRNKTVRYVYNTSRARLGRRYSTALMREQYKNDSDDWITIEGMQYLPDEDWVDFQR